MHRPVIKAKKASKKNDLEIVYNLQWNTKAGNGDKANYIVGMYDIPATTLNWDVFKSYLLKNSGIAEDDVKVSYITSENREFPIESQTNFQIALYAFRRKAMMGEIINLKLDQISKLDGGAAKYPSSNSVKFKSTDAETQFDCNVFESSSLAGSSIQQDGPPEWFLNYMAKFKKEIIEETTSKVSVMISNLKGPFLNLPSNYHPRKPPKLEKVLRCPFNIFPTDKEIARANKAEKWEEKQSKKLRSKAMKIPEKKLPVMTASKSSDSDSGQQQQHRVALNMDARPLTSQTVIPHMLGGEIYLHSWEVENTGSVAWNHNTSLNFSWGSKELKATDAVIPVPHLKPRESGEISVRIVVPYEPGLYEGYWHFKHAGVRFGEWLGCQLIVDEFNLKGNKSVLDTGRNLFGSPKKFKLLDFNKFNPPGHNVDTGPLPARRPYSAPLNSQEVLGATALEPTKIEKQLQMAHERRLKEVEAEAEIATKFVLDNLVRDVSAKIDDMKLNQDPMRLFINSDSDNSSVNSLSSNNSSYHDEFVVVPTPECFKLESPPQLNDICSLPELQLDLPQMNEEKVKSEENFDDNNNTEKMEKQKDTTTSGETSSEIPAEEAAAEQNEMVMISLPDKKDEEEKGYAFIMVDGVAIPIPKKILKEEYLKQSKGSEKTGSDVEESVSSSSSSVEIMNMPPEESKEAIDEEMSHCSAAGSCFSTVTGENQDFAFPQACADYEIVNSCRIEEESHQQSSENQQNPQPAPSAPPKPEFQANFVYPHVPNYQQTVPTVQTNIGTPRLAANPPEMQINEGYEAFMGMPYIQNDRAQENAQPVHILPETLVSGAVNVASSAINTARSVINMIKPKEPGRWVNGHWVSASSESSREANLRALGEMGFWDRDLNATLLARYNDDLNRVVSELVQ